MGAAAGFAADGGDTSERRSRCVTRAAFSSVRFVLRVNRPAHVGGKQLSNIKGSDLMGINRYIAKQFGNPAGVGGKIVSSVINRQNRPLYEDTIRLLAPSDSDSVLDIGCGNGYALKMLASRSACTLTGIDFSPSAIKTALSRNRKFVKNGKMNLTCQD